MSADTYEVLVDGLTVHRQIGELTDPVSGQRTGIQQGDGRVYFKGDVIPASRVSPLLIEALENEDHPNHESVSRKIRKSGDEASESPGQRLGGPFDGYDEMSEEEVVAAMRNLPSATKRRIIQYEQATQNRGQIVNFNIGYGVDPDAHQEDRVGSEYQEPAEDKPSARVKTRNVPEEGNVEHGEGITGDGTPSIPPGTAASEEDGDENPLTRRRRRRPRKTETDPDASSGENE